MTTGNNIKNATTNTGQSTRQSNMNRRSFLHLMGTGLAVTVCFPENASAEIYGPQKDSEALISAWIHIGEDGKTTVFTGKAEVGQNIRTSLAQIVAEELEISVDDIEMIMGDTALTPYDRGTFGSRSIPYMGPQLRKAAASAREYAVDLAATSWKTDRANLRFTNGLVTNLKTGNTISIGRLTGGKQLLKSVNENVNLKDANSWKVAGTSVRKVHGESYVTGQHKYVSDMSLPGMLFGKVLRPPAYGAALVSVDLSKAQSIKGVVTIHDGDFVALAAPSLADAMRALSSVKAQWKTVTQPSRKEIFELLKARSEGGAEKNNVTSENASSPYVKSEVKAIQTFYVDYIAHAPLEPRAGLAQWEGDSLTVWTGTQRPFGVQEDLEQQFRIPKEKIRVIMPDTGSGYGGKHTGEAGVEAARLARVAQKPVKVVWTREEEFTWAYFRPAGVIEVKASAANHGAITSWEFHNYNSGGSGLETPYMVSDKQEQYHPSDSPLRQGSYRGLAATANTFARESIMHDLSVDLKVDPLEFRLKNLKEARMKDVLNAAAKKFSWTNIKSTSHHGIGIACGEEKGGYVATCAEVKVDPDSGEVKVVRVVAAFECGAIINPNHLDNQITGSIIQGIGGALFERIDFEDGKILNAHFSQYRVPRFNDCPKIDVVMLDRKDIPSAGAGETPILAIAPAIRNAIQNATGKRLYTLPLVPNGLQRTASQ